MNLGGRAQGGVIFSGNALINFAYALGMLKSLCCAVNLLELNYTHMLDVAD